METTVVHYTEPFDVYIDRGSKWENPFKIGIDGATREEVNQKYREWVMAQPDLVNSLHELKGKRIASYGHPSVCHGTVLAELADEYDEADISMIF